MSVIRRLFRMMGLSCSLMLAMLVIGGTRIPQRSALGSLWNTRERPAGRAICAFRSLVQNARLEQTSVYRDHLSGDVTCLLGPEKRHDRSHLLGLTQTPERDFREQP